MWVNSASNASVFLDPLCYGYYSDDDEKLVSDITSSELLVNFPLPCTCQNFVKNILCPCRVKPIGCHKYCKYVTIVCKNLKTVVLP